MPYSVKCLNPEASYYVTCEAECASITPFMEFIMYRQLGLVDTHLQYDEKIISMSQKAVAIIANTDDGLLNKMWKQFISEPSVLQLYQAFKQSLLHRAVKNVMLTKSRQEKVSAPEKVFYDFADIDMSVEVSEQDIRDLLTQHLHETSMLGDLEATLLQDSSASAKIKESCIYFWASYPQVLKDKVVPLLPECHLNIENYLRKSNDALSTNTLTGVEISTFLTKLRAGERKVVKKEEKAVSQAIKRATKLFSRFGFEEELKAFCKGKAITIAHEDSAFQFKLSPYKNAGWLRKQSGVFFKHSPFDITLQTKEGLDLMQLCVYLENTPVLDQLLSWLITVEAGEENIFLEKANPFKIAEYVKEDAVSSLPSEYKIVKVVKNSSSVAGAFITQISERENQLLAKIKQYADKYADCWQSIANPISEGATV